jgi:hypothetical protein
MNLTLVYSLIFLMTTGTGYLEQQPEVSSHTKQSVNAVAPPESPASPEMDRLAKALAGNWDTTETMERSEIFPDGGSRHGTVHVRLASGGYTLIYEVHSNGSAGKLDGFHTIWWDRGTKLYYFLACFNNPDHPCRMRGTAHWDGDTFVNDYVEMIDGKKTQWRDSFTITATTHTLVAAMDMGHGTRKAFITTRGTRR